MAYDYYNEFQDHIKKVIGQFNSASVWDFHGLDDPIVVAVLDNGMDYHEDLPSSRLMLYNGADYVDGDIVPRPALHDTHGMSCGGIIGASHTTDSVEGDNSSSGMISLDPWVKILPIRIVDENGYLVSNDYVATGIRWARQHGADVISCSWGYTPETDYYSIDYELDLLNYYNIPIFFSSGNDAYHDSDLVNYPANYPSTFAVGASDLNDDWWSYSQYGPDLDIVAPSGPSCVNEADVFSLDQEGEKGYNPYIGWACGEYFSWNCGTGTNDENYNCKFGGTSAAAPIVAGTAALILSYKNTLTDQEVYDILRYSAVKEVGGGTITPPDTLYGYGRVDAFRAILSLARGDMNADGKINLADVVALNAYVYQQGPGGFPDVRLGNCDCSPDGAINLADVTLLIDHIYISKDPLPLPCFVY